MDAEWEDELSAGLEVQLETLESLDGSVDASMGAAGMSIGLDDEGGDGPTALGPLLVAGGSGGSEDDAMSVGGAGSVRSGDDGWFSDGDVDATVMVTSPRGNSEGAHGAEDSNTAGVEGAGVAAGEAHVALDDDDELDLAELDTSVVQAGAWDPDEDPVGSPSLKAPEWMEWGEGRTPRDSGTAAAGEAAGGGGDGGDADPHSADAAALLSLRELASARLDALRTGDMPAALNGEVAMLEAALNEAIAYANGTADADERLCAAGADRRFDTLRSLWAELESRAAALRDTKVAADALYAAAEELEAAAQGVEVSSLPEALEAGAVAKGAKRWVMDAEEAARRAGTDGTVPAMSPADVEARLEDVAVASARLRAARLAALDGEARRREEEREAARLAAEAAKAEADELRRREEEDRAATAAEVRQREEEARDKARAAAAAAEERARAAAAEAAEAAEAAKQAPPPAPSPPRTPGEDMRAHAQGEASEASSPVSSPPKAASPAPVTPLAPPAAPFAEATPTAAKEGGGGCCTVM